MLAVFVMPILEYTRSILLQCVLQSPHPVVVKVHFQFLLRKWSYLPYTFYSLNWTQMMVQIMTSTEILSAWFFKTLVSAVPSLLHLSHTARSWATLVCFLHSYIHCLGNPIYWLWWLNVWNISLVFGGFFLITEWFLKQFFTSFFHQEPYLITASSQNNGCSLTCNT